MTNRPDGRDNNQIRPIDVTPDFIEHPAGSVLFCMGRTKVICTATLEERVPRWLQHSGDAQGWLTAEYAMLPGSTHTRSRRETNRPSGRSMEIRRLIGRSLRACMDLKKLGERTITIDCDVLQADGGTRCASISGGFIALSIAVAKLLNQGKLTELPIIRTVQAISCGIIQGEERLDLPYEEDSIADIDMNLVVTGHGEIIEVQATAEQGLMARKQLDALIDLGLAGCASIKAAQQQALTPYPVLEALWAPAPAEAS